MSEVCILGEGPLWHPTANTLYHFDILDKKLFRESDKKVWEFDEHVSAAGWVEENSLLLASETGLWRFETLTGKRTKVVDLEADNPVTRSNDGRADPWGGFWIGTMGKKAEPKAGAIYRFYKGTLRQVVSDITVSNAICFAPDQSCAYYTDTVTQIIMRQPLSPENGWPEGVPNVLVDLSGTKMYPDGAVTDVAGNLWVAIWDSACIVCYSPDGMEQQRIEVQALRPTCPAFSGPDLRDLSITSATVGLDAATLAKYPLSGQTFVIPDVANGAPEPKVIL